MIQIFTLTNSSGFCISTVLQKSEITEPQSWKWAQKIGNHLRTFELKILNGANLQVPSLDHQANPQS